MYVFYKLVLPILNYGLQVWGLNGSSQIEKHTFTIL